jgi:hypothetical protein
MNKKMNVFLLKRYRLLESLEIFILITINLI